MKQKSLEEREKWRQKLHILCHSLPISKFWGACVMERASPFRTPQKRLSWNWCGRKIMRAHGRSMILQQQAFLLWLPAEMKTKSNFSVLMLLTSVGENNSLSTWIIQGNRKNKTKQNYLTAGASFFSSAEMKTSWSSFRWWSLCTKTCYTMHEFLCNVTMHRKSLDFHNSFPNEVSKIIYVE